MRNEILKKIQSEGLAILKLHEKLNELNIEHEFIDRKLKWHEKLNELNIEHEFIDRKEEQIKMAKEKKAIDVINEVCPFDYQILIEEDDTQISLIQSPYSYGITKNLIEAYNFQQEPVVLDHEMAAALISKKKLNSYIIVVNEKNDEAIKEIFQSLNN